MKNIFPSKAYSLKGKILVAFINILLYFVALIKKKQWKYPLKNFEENPRYYTFRDVVYFAFKYFYSQQVFADRYSGTEQYFESRHFPVPSPKSKITISLGGDLLPYSTINKKTCSSLWKDCGDFFFSSDIVFANLETPLDPSRKASLVPEVMITNALFNASEEIFDVFNGLGMFKGFDVLSIANNHALDQGKDGLHQTMRFLKSKNIAYTGGAISKNEVNDFPIIRKHGISTAFISFTFSLNKFELPPEDDWMVNHTRLNLENAHISKIVDQCYIARMRGADIVIVSLHMGNAYQAYPSTHIIKTIHRICKEACPDVIVAGHPHNPQPMEWLDYDDYMARRKKCLIFYSLGDFVGYDIYSWAHLSLLVKLNVTKMNKEAFISGFTVLPAYTSAEFKGQSISNLTLKHFEKVYLAKDTFSKRIQNDISTIYPLYETMLFSAEQRSAVVVDNIL